MGSLVEIYYGFFGYFAAWVGIGDGGLGLIIFCEVVLFLAIVGHINHKFDVPSIL